MSFERESREWAEAMVAEARRRMDMPGLGLPNDIVMQETGQSNIFICQPQARAAPMNLMGASAGAAMARSTYRLRASQGNLRPRASHAGAQFERDRLWGFPDAPRL